MVKHIVMWTLRESADGRTAADNALEMKSRLEALRGLVDGMLLLEVGVDFSRTPSSADVALYSEFTDRAALEAYASHPDHVAVADFVNGVRVDRVVADYEV
jgi:hypothetical protein